MTKSEVQTVSLPAINLTETQLQIPNVVFTLNIPFTDATKLFSTYINSKIDVSQEFTHAIQKLGLISNSGKFTKQVVDSATLFNKGKETKHFVIATYNPACSTAVISRVVRVQVLNPHTCVLSLKGVCKAKVIDASPSSSQGSPFGELTMEIESEDINLNFDIFKDVVTKMKQSLVLIQRFVQEFGGVDDDEFKTLLFKLNPFASLLYLQLSTENLELFAKDMNDIGTDARKALSLCDVFVAIFPFGFAQQMKYLDSSDPLAQLAEVVSLTDFVNTLFTQHLDVSQVYESWVRLGKLRNGRSLQSRFIVTQFKSLKKLLDKLSPQSNAKPQRIQPIGRDNNNNNNNNNDDDDSEENDLKNIQFFINNLPNLDISNDGKTMLTKDFKRLKKMQPTTTEYQQLRNYFDIVIDLPWSSKASEVNTLKDIDLNEAKRILDNDHFGMDSAKERILEFIAISKLTSTSTLAAGSMKSPILLLNGPPGVGKTSIAKSIAHCLGYEFQRVSLGGINDFADLKGHRRTYVGANPGLIIQALRKSKSMKLVILLDEIDKIGMPSNKGNPEAALLEILDPEQNVNFNDHYVGFPLDLSKIVFVATSNDKWDISAPLLDRMETIDLDGYTSKEKAEIGAQYIVPRQTQRNGLKLEQIVISKDVLSQIVHLYTHEAGIRNLERLVGKVCRKKAIELLTSKKFNPVVSKNDLITYLGVPVALSNSDKYSSGDSVIQEQYGLVNGLSYNSDGSGSLLKFEMVGVPGSQNIAATGMLGEVLMESCNIAETLVEQLINTHEFVGYEPEKLIERLQNTSVHMHVPQGSIRKDGPSAGLTMTLCYLSLILQHPVPSDIAMTGEVTLTAKALPIGGLKEKLLGASMTGKINKVIVPRLNRQDLISAYVESFKDRDEANIALTKLVLEEENCLSKLSERYSFGPDVENWICKDYGIEIKYVDDFMDIIRYVWDNKLQIKRKELKAHL